MQQAVREWGRVHRAHFLHSASRECGYAFCLGSIYNASLHLFELLSCLQDLVFNLLLNLLPLSYSHLLFLFVNQSPFIYYSFIYQGFIMSFNWASIFIRIVIFVCALVARSIHFEWSPLTYFCSIPSDFYCVILQGIWILIMYVLYVHIKACVC